jgi:hypothetical protein
VVCVNHTADHEGSPRIWVVWPDWHFGDLLPLWELREALLSLHCINSVQMDVYSPLVPVVYKRGQFFWSLLSHGCAVSVRNELFCAPLQRLVLHWRMYSTVLDVLFCRTLLWLRSLIWGLGPAISGRHSSLWGHYRRLLIITFQPFLFFQKPLKLFLLELSSFLSCYRNGGRLNF